MSGKSSGADAWFTLLDDWDDGMASRERERPVPAPDDPRLGEVVVSWGRAEGVCLSQPVLRPGQGVLIGFPVDEGVRRNGGRVGAADAPNAIRRQLYRLTPWDGATGADLTLLPPCDLGNVRRLESLEEMQAALGSVVSAVLRAGAVPVVLGGGHECAYGSYLGYVAAGQPVGIINLDAHLDVRPLRPLHPDDKPGASATGTAPRDGRPPVFAGHSGSPFRQALEHPTHPLPGAGYVCLGAQPHAVSRQHLQYALARGAAVHWRQQVDGVLQRHFDEQSERIAGLGCRVHVSVDADVVRSADVPGTSAPDPAGLSGLEVLDCLRRAGSVSAAAGMDLAEINPRFDRDGQSARWGALAVWHFLAGLAMR